MQTESADWYKSVLNAMRDMVLVKGPRSRLLWANRAFLNYYGMTEAQLRDFVDAEHSDPDDTLQYVIADQTVFDTGLDLDVPSEVVTDASNNARNFHTIKSPVVKDGQTTQIVAVARLIDDTTINQRGVSHVDAKAYTAPLRTLTGTFPLPMMMVDVALRIVKTSPLWQSSFGAMDLTPNTFFEDAYPGLDTLPGLIRTCFATHELVETTVTRRNDEGSQTFYSVHISPWTAPGGALGGATIVATDVTALHAQTAALQKTNDELMQFSYRASHDLKGPLSTVKGLAEFIVHDIEDGELDEAKENGLQIRQMMQNLEETVISILALTRAELKEETTCMVSLPEMMDEICGGLALQIEAGDIAIKSDFQIERLQSEAPRLRQILENLISNAVKYRSKDRNDSFVDVRSVSRDGGIEISVEDNGIGLPEEARGRVFDMFTRFHAGIDGSGLGLAIVKKHVDVLGGEIAVERTPQGTMFRVFLPSLSLEDAA